MEQITVQLSQHPELPSALSIVHTCRDNSRDENGSCLWFQRVPTAWAEPRAPPGGQEGLSSKSGMHWRSMHSSGQNLTQPLQAHSETV